MHRYWVKCNPAEQHAFDSSSSMLGCTHHETAHTCMGRSCRPPEFCEALALGMLLGYEPESSIAVHYY